MCGCAGGWGGGGGSGEGGGDIGDQFVYINIVSVLMLSIVYEIYLPAAYFRMGAPRLHYYSCFHPCLRDWIGTFFFFVLFGKHIYRH